MDTETLSIINGLKVTVPASIRYMSNYILREQNDWFEDEIKFLRQYLKPGMKVIDIGANYGLYSLSCAQAVGDKGSIWAFEPATNTYKCLADSIEKNGIKQISAIQLGLSDKPGEATLYTTDNSELNSMERTQAQHNEETITLTTLDLCMQEYDWQHIDLIKMDAEGEESRIINAGIRLLENTSPLIMYELKHGANINKPLIEQFVSLGYENYRLIPSTNTLVPFDLSAPIGGYQLNLFCCKTNKAEQLAEDDWLLPTRLSCEAQTHAAQNYISGTLYQDHTTEADQDSLYLNILDLYAMALDTTLTRRQQTSLLLAALENIRKIQDLQTFRPEQLSSIARVALAAGERQASVNLLNHILQHYPDASGYSPEGIYYPAHPSFDHKPITESPGAWLLASVLEQFIEIHAYSAYFVGPKVLTLFERLSSTGYMSEDMSRRHQLAKQLFS